MEKVKLRVKSCLVFLSIFGLIMTKRSVATKSGTTVDYNHSTSLPLLTTYTFALNKTTNNNKLPVPRGKAAYDVSLDVSYATKTSERDAGLCQWFPHVIKCKNNVLDLKSLGCSNENNTIKQQKEFVQESGNNANSHEKCLEPTARTIQCKACEIRNWSNWTSCCLNESCVFDIIGSVGKYMMARYSNVSMECQNAFHFDRACSMKVDTKRCKPTPRAVNPDLNPDDGANEESDSTKAGLNPMVMTIIFCLAGIATIALFGFAGTRLVRTMYVNPAGRSSQISRSCQNGQNNQYFNGSFRISRNNEEVETGLLMAPSFRGNQRGAPPVSRLSIIPEEDALSTSVQDPGDAPSTCSSPTPSHNEADDEVIASIDFMDNVLTQIEENEKDHDEKVYNNDGYRRSNTENDGLLNKFGWNTSARSREPSSYTVEMLKTEDSTECLAASDLSLASNNLLQNSKSRFDASSMITSSSSLSESEDSYSLKDISDCETKSNKLTREYMSLPDVSRMRECIPDVEEILSDSDFSNADGSALC